MFLREKKQASASGRVQNVVWRRVKRPALLVALVLLATASHALTQNACVPNKRVGLSLAFRTNRTGHPLLNAHLEQPAKNAPWQLDIEMGTSACHSTRTTFHTVTMSLSGAPLNSVPPGYTTLPGLGHFRRPTVAVPWEAARNGCALEGATLAVPATQQELDALRAAFSLNVTATGDRTYMWVGATDSAQDGKFVTVTGVPLHEATSLPWASGQPDGRTNQNCLVYDTGAAAIRDIECSSKYAYICKIDL